MGRTGGAIERERIGKEGLLGQVERAGRLPFFSQEQIEPPREPLRTAVEEFSEGRACGWVEDVGNVAAFHERRDAVADECWAKRTISESRDP